MKKQSFFFTQHGVIFGAISSIFCLFFISAFGSPFDMIHKLNGIGMIPPIWIINLLLIVFFFLQGFSFGSIITAAKNRINVGEKELCAYRGTVFLSCAFFLSLLWYPLFFFAEKLFLSLLVSIVCLIFSILCAIEWLHAEPIGASITVFVCSIFEFYILFINLSVFFTN